MTETETPDYAERDDDETTEQTGGGIEPGGEGWDDPGEADAEDEDDS